MWQHVATGWPNARNMLRPTMLGYVALNVAIVWPGLNIMPGRGGRRAGSGRKKIHESKAAGSRFWQKGKTRVWIDNNLYLAWISARSACGFVNDASFIAHLLALEKRRRLVSWNSALT